jgi:hypothetical protein
MRALIIRDVLLDAGKALSDESDRLLDAFFGGVGVQGAAA